MSFPEFSNRMKCGYKGHPVVRLGMWVAYVREFVGLPLTPEQLDRLLAGLRHLNVYNRQGLPFFESEPFDSEMKSIDTVKADCLDNLDLTDLEAIQKAILKGYTID